MPARCASGCPEGASAKDAAAFNTHSPGGGRSGLAQHVFRSPARIQATESRTGRPVRRPAKRKTLYVIACKAIFRLAIGVVSSESCDMDGKRRPTRGPSSGVRGRRVSSTTPRPVRQFVWACTMRTSRGALPALAGVNAASAYCYLLAMEQHRDADTCGVHLLDAVRQVLKPDYRRPGWRTRQDILLALSTASGSASHSG